MQFMILVMYKQNRFGKAQLNSFASINVNVFSLYCRQLDTSLSQLFRAELPVVISDGLVAGSGVFFWRFSGLHRTSCSYSYFKVH